VTDLEEPDDWGLQRDAVSSGKIDRRSGHQIRRAGTADRSGRPCGVNPPRRCTRIAFDGFSGIAGPSRSAKSLSLYKFTT